MQMRQQHDINVHQQQLLLSRSIIKHLDLGTRGLFSVTVNEIKKSNFTCSLRKYAIYAPWRRHSPTNLHRTAFPDWTERNRSLSPGPRNIVLNRPVFVRCEFRATFYYVIVINVVQKRTFFRLVRFAIHTASRRKGWSPLGKGCA